MTRIARPARRITVLALTGALALAATLGCDGGSNGTSLAGTSLTLTCTPSATTVTAGGTGASMTIVLSSNGVAVPGRTVSFSATAGSVTPASGVTAADGSITVQFVPPSVAGTVVVTAQVTDGDPSDQVTSTCTFSVVGGSDPQLTVSVIAPSELAGLTIVVTYTDVAGLAVANTEALGGLTGTDCVTPGINAPGNGTITIVTACPSLRPVAGADAARITFDNLDGELHAIGEFQVACSGVDVTGSTVGTACALDLTQI